MKKSGFIITETILALIFAASATAVGALIVDLKTNSLHLDKFNPFVTASTADNAAEKSSFPESTVSLPSEKTDSQSASGVSSETVSDISSRQSNPESSAMEVSQQSQEKSDQSTSNSTGTSKLLSEPKNLNKQCKELVEKLGDYGYTIESNVSGNRLIYIDTKHSDTKSGASVYCYQKSDKSGYWWNVAGDNNSMTDSAFVSKNGVVYDADVSGNQTPAGMIRIKEGFYIGDKPDTTYPLFEITDSTYWVTDPQSKFYNQRVEDTKSKDWKSADHMIASDKTYKYGLVISYNTDDPDPKLTNCIFMQCGNAPTEGSIALPEPIMRTILEWLDSDSVAEIFITI